MPQSEFQTSVAIAGTDGRLASGIVYKIKSSNGVVLDDWDGQTGHGTASLALDDAGNSNNRIWQIVPSEGSSLCRIRSSHKTVYDDWGGDKKYTGKGTASLMKDDGGASSSRIWKFCPVDFPYFRIVSNHSVAFDDWGGVDTGKGTLSQMPDDSVTAVNRRWHFIPSYDMNVVLTDFVFLGDTEAILNNNLKVDFMSEYTAIVGQGTTGTISQQFTKIQQQVYTYALNQRLCTSFTVQATAGVPLVGNITTSVTSQAEVQQTNEWTHKEGKEFSTGASMQNQPPGTYKMSGWVKCADNVKFDFTAKAVITAKGLKWRKDNTVGEDAAMSGDAVNSFLMESQDYPNIKIEKVNANSVQAIVTGKMTGTYGMSSFTKFQKIA